MRPVVLLPLLALSGQLHAGSETCPGGQFTVAADGSLAVHICEVAERATDELRACNLSIDRPLRIEVRDSFEADCVGLYHCGGDLVEILSPDVLETQRPEAGIFGVLDTMDWFDSVLFHELVHAAFDDIPCPFESCVTTTEYLAYALQIRDLGPEAIAAMGLEGNGAAAIPHEAINSMILFWAPDRFAQKAWTHLMQRDDPCAYVGEIAAGRERFEFGYEYP